MTDCHMAVARSQVVVGWNPWAALKQRRHLRLEYRAMHPSAGRIVDHGNGQRTITLRSTLSQVERSCTLSHELIHDEYDLIWPPDCPEGLRAKGEHLVERISDERLLPITDLQEWVDRRGGVIHRWEVAQEFGVTEAVAERQMARCAWGF